MSDFCRRHPDEVGYCTIVCEGCRQSCGSHYYDGRINPSTRCTFVDPDPKKSWLAGWYEGFKTAEAQMINAVDSLDYKKGPAKAGEEV